MLSACCLSYCSALIIVKQNFLNVAKYQKSVLKKLTPELLKTHLIILLDKLVNSISIDSMAYFFFFKPWPDGGVVVTDLRVGPLLHP